MGIILEGISMLLMPKPKGPASQQIESKVDQASYLFSSLQNQAVQGFPIPMLYGELRVGSAIVSVNVLNEDIESE
jgi:predicted phage tail protein